MLISERRFCRGLSGVAVAASLLVGAVGCGGGDSGDDPARAAAEKSVAAEGLCGGAVSAEAGKTLKVITGSARFEASAKTSTVAHAAEEMIGVFSPLAADAPGGNGDVCRIYTPVSAPGDELRVTWHLSYRNPGKAGLAAKFTPLDMGERAGTAPDGAFIGFACRSEKLSGSEETPAHIEIGVERTGLPKEPDGDAEALRKAYATVTHSVSLALAKQLGCDGDGGLEARPSLNPA